MSTEELLKWWPAPEAVAACVKIDAEASSDAVSLAVHQPMTFERRTIGGDQNKYDGICDEHALLREFLKPILSDGLVILPIVGTSGVGKSHVVRWLYVQMQHMPGSERRVVIRVPKGISLKNVLGLLLDSVQGPQYEKHRQALTRAQEVLEPDSVSGLLCETLAQALTAMYEAGKQTLLQKPGDRDAQEREAYCRASMLPGLFRNQSLRDQYFVRSDPPGIVRRLVEHLTEERPAGSEDDRKHVFVPDDLKFENVDQNELGPAERRAVHGFQTHEERRHTAVRLLNEALDEAKHRVLHLDPTVADLFEKVRRELLAENKELVLLVEDFVVLSGVQKQFLQVIIKQAMSGGRQDLCVMRTALAYTPGYIDAATVLSRAGKEYRIADSVGSEDELLERIVSQVGAYLNAARIGQQALEEAHAARSGSESGNLREWVPTFGANVEPETREMLDAFGRSDDEYELFPFNRNAIHEFAREGCRVSGNLVYNPRLVIQNILDKVLRNRDAFADGTFPGDGLGGARPLAQPVIAHVQQRVPESETRRYLRFLGYWGGFPERLTELDPLNERVFAAFGLEKKRLVIRSGPAAMPGRPTPAPPPQPAPAPGPAEHPLEAKWRGILENWRRGQTLPQSDARELRKWVAEAVLGCIDWNWDLFQPLSEADTLYWSQYVYVPRAGGGEGRGAEESMAAVCTEADLGSDIESARVHGALMAIVQCHAVHRGVWDFDGAEESLSRYMAFIEPLSENARRFVKERYFRTVWNPLPALVKGLTIGARVLGVEGSARDSHLALIKAALGAVPVTENAPGAGTATPDLDAWRVFVEQLRQSRTRVEREGRTGLSWRDHVLNLAGARQGEGELVYALDVLRLKPAIEAVLKNWEFESVSVTSPGSAEFTHLRTAAQALRTQSSAVEKMRRHLFEWQRRVKAWTGGEFEKTELVREIEATLETIRSAGIATGGEVSDCLRLLKEFRDAPIKEALADTARLTEEAPRGTVLAILGSGHDALVPPCEALMRTFDSVLATVESQIRAEVVASGEHPLQTAVALLAARLDEATTLLQEVETHDAA